MAYTITGILSSTSFNSSGSTITFTGSVQSGDVIILGLQIGGQNPQISISSIVDQETGNTAYRQLNVRDASDQASREWVAMYWKVAKSSYTPQVTATYTFNLAQPQAMAFRLRGWTGTPTPDLQIGSNSFFEGNSTSPSWSPISTNWANEFILFMARQQVATSISGFSGYTQQNNDLYARIFTVGGTDASTSGTYSPTGEWVSVAGGMYDFPGLGDDLITTTNTDIVTFDSNFSYTGESSTNFILVGSAGAFCNNQTGGNSVNAFWSGSNFTADQQAQVALPSPSTGNILSGAGVGVRYTPGASGPNGYAVYFTSTQYNLFSLSNGSITTLIGGPQAHTTNANDVITLKVAGNTLTIAVNGATIKTITDNTWTQGSPFIAFGGTRPSTTVDYFRAGSLGINAPSLQLTTLIGQVGGQVAPKLTQQTIASSSSSSGLTVGLSNALGPITATFIEGQLVFVFNITGQSATFSEGALTTSITSGSTVQFSSQTAQFTIGPPLDNISYILDQGATTINLFSQTASFVEGSLMEVVSPALGAQTVTDSVGTPTIAMTLLTFSSQAATFTEGVISAVLGNNIGTTLGAQTLTALQGLLGEEVDYFPSAQTGSFVVGTITFSLSGQFTITLGSQQLTFSEGLMSVAALSTDEWVVRQRLVNAGLIPIVQYNEDPGTPSGAVISLAPPQGTVVPVNSPVVMVVSRGPSLGLGTTTVPNLVGFVWLDATNALANAMLSEDKFVWQVNPANAGTVVAQSVPPGTAATPGTLIQLTLSAGPARVPATVPVPPFQ